MTTLVLGGTGATGRLLVAQLLERGEQVRAIVRSPLDLPDALRTHENLTLIHRSVLDIDAAELAQHVNGCQTVVSCLGHTTSFKGMYGRPRLLVTEATRRLCNAIMTNQPKQRVKFVLMNTTGNRNHDRHEHISIAERLVIALIRLLVPPHVDNEKAADYLRVEIGQHHEAVAWAVVRPDTLTDENEITDFDVYRSPIRSAIFNSGKTSRINVGGFMADLITDPAVWKQWVGQMPVIYNRT